MPSSPPITDPSRLVENDTAACLNAFLAASEENSVEFASAFTALTMQQRMKVLLAIDGDPYAEMAQDGPRRIVELFEALDAEGASHAKEAASLALPAAAKSSLTVRRLLRRTVNDASEEDGLEVVELQEAEAVHTGAITALFSETQLASPRSSTDDSTSEASDSRRHSASRWPTGGGMARRKHTAFDNFFDGDGDEDGTHLRSVAPLSEERDWSGVVPPAIDDFLAVDGGDGENGADAAQAKAQAHHDPCEEVDEAMLRRTAPRHQCDGEGDEESLSDESVMLPGLEATGEEDAALHNEPLESLQTWREAQDRVLSELRGVIEEEDNCVHAFSIDPNFDHDKDLFGQAFRRQQGWRDCGRS